VRAERPEVLVSLDEEGGDVTRLDTAFPGNGALGVVDDVLLTRDVGAALGAELAAVGVNLDLAPVADVNTNPRNPVIGIRSFGSDPVRVGAHVAAFVRGLQSQGVAACAKHFPGHGDTAQDSHLELPTMTANLEPHLVPFRAAIEAGVRSIMTAHIVVPALDDVPATLSRRILHDLLRDELGFEGLVITDALEMRGISGTFAVEEAAVRALAAGADALCLGHDLGEREVERIHAELLEAVRDGRLSEERVAEAAERNARTWVEGDAGEPDPGIGLAAARRAVRVEGDVALEESPLVVELRPRANIAAGPARHSLGELLAAETVVVEEGDEPTRIGDRQLVLVVRDAARHEWMRATAEALLAHAHRPVVVELGLPGWHPDEAGSVATFGGGRVNLEAALDHLRPRGPAPNPSK
jgi:beta-N-acetylhexosaminidase